MLQVTSAFEEEARGETSPLHCVLPIVRTLLPIGYPMRVGFESSKMLRPTIDLFCAKEDRPTECSCDGLVRSVPKSVRDVASDIRKKPLLVRPIPARWQRIRV